MGVVSPSQGIDIRPGFDFVIPDSGIIDFSVELDIAKVGGLAEILGFELTEDCYWLLGPSSDQPSHDKIVQIDRNTGHVVDQFILPDSHRPRAPHTGLARDPSTSLFYTNFFPVDASTPPQIIRVLKLTPGVVVNDLVTFETIAATFTFLPESAGCPAGFVGTFSFEARLTNVSERALSNLIVAVLTLTNGNLLKNADGGPKATGALLTVPREADLSDGILSPDEFVDVPFQVCLLERTPFHFAVEVLGAAE